MPQAKTLRDLLRIRQVNAPKLRQLAGYMGTAVGYKWREADGVFETDASGAFIPAVLIFVQKKIPQGALPAEQIVPPTLTGSNGLICATDVITGAMPDGAPEPPALSAANEKLLGELRSGASGVMGGMVMGTPIPGGSGRYNGTATCVVRDPATARLSLLTNAHVAKNVGQAVLCNLPGVVPLGKTTVSIMIAPKTPHDANDLESFTDVQHRLDCALVELTAATAPLAKPGVYMLPPLGELYSPSLDTLDVLGKKVLGLGQKRGLQRGTIIAYGYEWETADDGVAPYVTNYLIVGEGKQPFACGGDSGKLVLTDDGAYRPIAILWGGEDENFWGGKAQRIWNYASDLGQVLQTLKVEIFRG